MAATTSTSRGSDIAGIDEAPEGFIPAEAIDRELVTIDEERVRFEVSRMCERLGRHRLVRA